MKLGHGSDNAEDKEEGPKYPLLVSLGPLTDRRYTQAKCYKGEYPNARWRDYFTSVSHVEYQVHHAVNSEECCERKSRLSDRVNLVLTVHRYDAARDSADHEHREPVVQANTIPEVRVYDTYGHGERDGSI